MTQRAALYARVSLEKQTTEQQIVALREAADRMRLGVTSVIEETGSGAKADRPGLLALMEAARRRKVSTVLVWKLDRLGRSLIDLVKNLDELRGLGVRVVAVTRDWTSIPRRTTRPPASSRTSLAQQPSTNGLSSSSAPSRGSAA